MKYKLTRRKIACNTKKYSGIFLIAILLIFSCTKKESLENNIDFSLEKLSDSTLSDEILNYAVVKLETTDDSKINLIKKVVIQNDRIFVLNHQENKQEILIFSLDGKFLDKISENGKGEISFSSIADFDINPINGNVTILDQKKQQLVIFGEDTNFIESHKINSPAYEIAYGTDDGMVFSVLHTKPSDDNSNSGHEISIYDENYKLLRIFFPNNNQNYSTQSNKKTLMKREDKVMYLREGTNNLYEIDSKKCRNISNFIFTKPVLPTDKMYDAFFSGKVDLSQYTYNVGYFESDSIVYLTFSTIEGNFIGLYNKKSGSSSLFNILLDPACSCGIKIDIAGIFENAFIVQIPRNKIPDVMKVLDNDGKKCNNEEMFKIIDNMKPGENPILLLLKFKS